MSVQGGPFTVGITWQHGALQETFMKQLAVDFEERLLQGASNGLLLAELPRP
jgi:hypothetical protein